MPGPRNSPHSPAEIQARGVQLENDTAALHLIRGAGSYELRGAKLAAIGNVTVPATLAKAAMFRAVATRLVLDGRPASLGVLRRVGACCGERYAMTTGTNRRLNVLLASVRKYGA